MIKTTVHIEGMMCGMCESHINTEIRKTFEGCKVKANRHKKQAVIESEERLSKDLLKERIEALGYDVSAISSKEVNKRKPFWKK